MNYLNFHHRLQHFPVFSTTEIEKIFPSFDSRRLVEWQEKGYIKKIRNRFYTFSEQHFDEFRLFLIANKMYKPSYISLESALSYYNFIPEGVFQMVSVTSLKTNSFNTPVGKFSYRHVKPALFFGYELVRFQNFTIQISTPEKTLIDYLYLNPTVTDLDDLHSLRWNGSEINNRVDFERLSSYEKFINSGTLSKKINLLKRYLDA